ncbi:hypothetical protein PO909_011790 [Leuciscus waleckii]
MPLAQLAEPWPKMELVQLETENGQSTTEDGVTADVKACQLKYSSATLEIRLRGAGLSVHRSAVWSVPSTPYNTKCIDAALSPLRHQGVHVLNYLDDWLVLAQSRTELLTHRDLILGHLKCLGLKINVTKSKLNPSQSVIFLGTVIDTITMTARLTQERALSVQKLVASFKAGERTPLKKFEKLLGLMATASSVLRMDYCACARCSTTQTPCANPCMAVRQPVHHGESRLFTDPDSLAGSGLVPRGCHHVGIFQEESVFYRRIQPRLGSPARGQACLRPLVEHGAELTYQLSGNESSLIGPQSVSVKPQWTSRLSPHGQHVSGGLHKSPGQRQVGQPVRHGERPPLVGTDQSELSEGSTYPWHSESGCGYALTRQHSRRVVPELTDGQSDMECVRRGRSRPFRLENQHQLRSVLLEEQGPWVISGPARPFYAFPPVSIIPQVIKRVRESGFSLWKSRPWFPDLVQLMARVPWPVPLRKCLLTQANGTIWHLRPDSWALHDNH